MTRVLVTLLLLSSGAAFAAEPVEPGPMAKCAESDGGILAATTALRDLDDAITKLEPGSPTAVASAILQRALGKRCLKLAREESRLPDESTPAIAWKTWWKNGGEWWLDSYLVNDSAIVVPPDVRRVLDAESKPRSPLAPLLCNRADAACGIETAGWVIRANAAFHARALEGGPFSDRERKAPAVETCNAKLTTWKEAQRYSSWRACLISESAKEARMPLGGTRAPSDGWLVLRGRRGHYGFCDEIRAYSLVDGAAWIVGSCSGLSLRADGTVDTAGTDARRGLTVTAGRVPVENLREAAWMLLLAPEVERGVQDASLHAVLPAGLVARIPDDEITIPGLSIGSIWSSSSQTQLSVGWIRDGKLAVTGSTTWPNSSSPGETHADDLVRIAEAALVPGCPGEPPKSVFLEAVRAPGVHPLDAPDGVDSTQRALLKALETSTCHAEPH